jgi:hypothetical protein
MATADNAGEVPRLFSNPWPLLIAGIVALIGGTAIGPLVKDAAPGLAVSLLALGALLSAGAIVIRWQSPLIWGLGAVSASIGSVGFREVNWDSGQLLFLVLMAAAAVGAIVVQLPLPARRVVISALLVVHFGGILTAITSAAPGTWLANTLWTYFYKPYLQFMYLNNAYHFYSPEPGPAPLMWFCILYQPNLDGSPNWRWVKVPDFDDEGRPLRPDGTRLWPNNEYTRRLSLAESINFPGRNPTGPELQELFNRRLQAGNIQVIPLLPPDEMPIEAQYRATNELAFRWMQSYVRHVAHKYKHERRPELPVLGVKVYRVIHDFVYPRQVVEGWGPFDETLYHPFYEGEFDQDGNPKGIVDKEGRPLPPDPFLHWLIPIVHEHSGQPATPGPPKGKTKNYVLVHAGVEDEGVLP